MKQFYPLRSRVLMFLFLACAHFYFSQVSGIIQDAQTGKPVEKARVFIKSAAAASRADGTFTLAYEGTYPATLTVQKANYETFTQVIEGPSDGILISFERFSTEDISEITITARRREETA